MQTEVNSNNSENSHSVISHSCEFKIAYTQEKQYINITLQTHSQTKTFSQIMESISSEIRNKFNIKSQTNFDIISSSKGEEGDPITCLPQQSIADLFNENKKFYIRLDKETTTDYIECPVCYSHISIKNKECSQFYQCTHSMCNRCQRRMLNNCCPLCRAPPREPVTPNPNPIRSPTRPNNSRVIYNVHDI